MGNTDRIEKIKTVWAMGYVPDAEVDWLIAEVERLRAIVRNVSSRLSAEVISTPNTGNTPESLADQVALHLRAGRTELAEIHDLLAEALGYHKDAEDDPNSPCPGGYVTGDRTAVTLAMEAARRLESLITFYMAAKPFAVLPDESGPQEAQYASNGETIGLRRELAARQRQCSCAYWPECDQIIPSPECPTHGVEAHNKKMLGERAIQELQTLRRILLGKGKSYGGRES